MSLAPIYFGKVWNCLVTHVIFAVLKKMKKGEVAILNVDIEQQVIVELQMSHRVQSEPSFQHQAR